MLECWECRREFFFLFFSLFWICERCFNEEYRKHRVGVISLILKNCLNFIRFFFSFQY